MLARLSHLPIVNLNEIAPPTAGFSLDSSSVCAKKFRGGEQCRLHYEKLQSLPASHDQLVQCPFGLASIPVTLGKDKFALTGFVPFPRIGGGAEKTLAKDHPSFKISIAGIHLAVNALRDEQRHFDALELYTVQQQSMALHEIRKLNLERSPELTRLCSPKMTHLASNCAVHSVEP